VLSPKILLLREWKTVCNLDFAVIITSFCFLLGANEIEVIYPSLINKSVDYQRPFSEKEIASITLIGSAAMSLSSALRTRILLLSPNHNPFPQKQGQNSVKKLLVLICERRVVENDSWLHSRSKEQIIQNFQTISFRLLKQNTFVRMKPCPMFEILHTG
jgi:hypothetical protein